MATWADLGNERYVNNVDYNDSRLVTALPNLIQEVLGKVRPQIDIAGVEGTRTLKFVKLHASSAAAAAGNLLHWTDATHTTVTTDQSAALTGTLNDVAGVAIGTLTAGYYGWILIKGKATLTIQGAVTVTAGDSLIASTTDTMVNKVDDGTASTNAVVGYATANGSGAGGTVVAHVILGDS